MQTSRRRAVIGGVVVAMVAAVMALGANLGLFALARPDSPAGRLDEPTARPVRNAAGLGGDTVSGTGTTANTARARPLDD